MLSKFFSTIVKTASLVLGEIPSVPEKGPEKQANRPLTPQKRGPKKRPELANEQVLFSFDSF